MNQESHGLLSLTSRNTADSNVSPASTKPASVVYKYGGWRGDLAKNACVLDGLFTRIIMLGSCLGQ